MHKHAEDGMKKAWCLLIAVNILIMGLAPATRAAAVAGTSYEVFMSPALLQGCNPTTLTFRPDYILQIDCMDGFGMYGAVGNFFAGFYHAPDYYLQNDATLFLSGFVVNPLFLAGSLTFVGKGNGAMALVGYPSNPQE